MDQRQQTVPVRVLLCTPELPGYDGSSRLVLDFLRYFKSRGHVVDCAVLRTKVGAFDPDEYPTNGVVRDYVHPIGQSNFSRQTYRIGRRLLPRRVGGMHFCPPGFLRMVGDFPLEEYDLAVTVGANFAGLTEILSCPVVCDMHELFTHKAELLSVHGIVLPSPYVNLEEEVRALSRFDAVWCPSHFIRDTLVPHVQQTILLDRHISHEGIVPEGYRPIHRPNAIPPRLIFAGSTAFENQPGMKVFLRQILPRIRKIVPNVEFHIVGWESDDLPEGVDLRGVVAHGRLRSRAHVLAQFDEVDIVVIPRYLGGLTIKGVETLTLGKAAVGHPMAFSGCYQIENGKQAAIAATSAEFANAVVRLLDDPVARRVMGEEARRFALTTFAPDNVYRGLLQLVTQPKQARERADQHATL